MSDTTLREDVRRRYAEAAVAVSTGGCGCGCGPEDASGCTRHQAV